MWPMIPDTDQPGGSAPPRAEREAARTFFDGWESLCLQGAEAFFRLNAQTADLIRGEKLPPPESTPPKEKSRKTGNKKKSGEKNP